MVGLLIMMQVGGIYDVSGVVFDCYGGSGQV